MKINWTYQQVQPKQRFQPFQRSKCIQPFQPIERSRREGGRKIVFSSY